MKYRREIDGLRAVAVLPVIFFHAGFEVFSGGFVGVDVFFVISGYLITTIILTEMESGQFKVINFYERRARRILPALFFVMFASLPFAWNWMLPGELEDFSNSLVAVSIFSSNILFWLESGYFETAAELKPFLHTWSLAVEEQYYLLFPLLILLTWRFGKKILFAVLFLVGLTSLAFMQWGVRNAPDANFYLLPFRLWELLLGSLIAFYLFTRNKNQRSSRLCNPATEETLSAVGLLLILFAIFQFNDRTPFPSVYSLIPTVGTALIILFAADSTLTAKFLSIRLFVGIGLISYSAYLWHQPVFAFARLRSIDEPHSLLMATLGLVSLALAFFTWKYVEKPYRDKTRFSRRSIFQSAAALSVVVVALGTIGDLNEGFESRATADGIPFVESQLDDRFRINYGLSTVCNSTFTLADECRTDDYPEIIIWGDSFAMHLLPGILSSNPNARIIQMTKSVCGPIIGVSPTNKDFPSNWADGCIEFNNRVLEWIEDSDSLRYAVLASPFSQYLTNEWKLKTAHGVIPADQGLVFRYLSSTLDELAELGIESVIFAPPPSNGKNIGDCLSKTVFFGDRSEKCNITLSDYRDHQKQIVEFLEQIDAQHRVIWINDAICDGSTCSAELDGQFIYRDEVHLSHEGSSYLGKKMDFYTLITSGRSASIATRTTDF